jgi:mannose-1-phosphate guanylyltransferase
MQLIRAGSLWNSGIFVWRVSTILHWLQRFSPAIFQGLTEIQKARGKGLGGLPSPPLLSVLRREYQKMPAVSIDTAVLEKAGAAGQVLTVKADFGWSDLGSWESLHQLLPHDSQGNATIGTGLAVDAKGCLIFSPHRLVVLLGVKNTVIVDSPDALLVADRKRTQEIREVVSQLQARGYKRYLSGSG